MWSQLGEVICRCDIVNNEGYIFKCINADQIPRGVVEHKLQCCSLDRLGSFNVPPEPHVKAATSGRIKRAVAVTSTTRALFDEVTQWPLHLNPRDSQCVQDKVELITHKACDLIWSE